MRKSISERVNKISDSVVRGALFEQGVDAGTFVLTPMLNFRSLGVVERPADVVAVGVLCNGTAKLTIDGRQFELHRNSLCILREFSVLSDFRCSKACMGYVIYFSNAILEAANLAPVDMLTVNMMFGASPCLQVNEEDIARLHSIAASLNHFAAESANQYESNARASLFKSFFFTLASIISKYATAELGENPQLSRTDDLMRRFIELLGTSCERERSVDFYASQLGVTPKYLSLVCKKKTGYNASKLIDSTVISKAKELLRQQGMSILEVSERLNFVSQSFFGKYFKQRTGISPSRYKAQH